MGEKTSEKSKTAAKNAKATLTNPERELDRVKNSLFSRTLSLAKFSVKAGSNWAGKKLQRHDLTPGSEDFKAFLKGQAEFLTQELGELKGSIMKAGQMLSLYGEHFLPPEANQILKKLQSQSSPVKWSVMETYLRAALGQKLDQLSVDPKAMASASLGQVHRAQVKATGESLALKIQYPGVDRAIDSDLKALRMLLSVTKVLPSDFKADSIFAEVREMLEQEVDYVSEMKLTREFHERLIGDSRYIVPAINEEFCTKSTLATRLEKGLRVDDPLTTALTPERRNRLALNFLELYLRELFQWKIVQTDPHPGNYAIRLQPDGSDQWILYDFGASRKYSEEFIHSYHRMICGSLLGDRVLFDAAARELRFLKVDEKPEIVDLFRDFCDTIVEPFLSPEDPRSRGLIDAQGRYNFGTTDLPQRVTQKVFKIVQKMAGRSPPREILFLDRKTGGVFMIMSILKANVNGRELLLKYLGID